MSEIRGLSAAQRAYDAMTPRDAGPCPQCEAEEWRQRVLDMLDGAPVSDKAFETYQDRLHDLAEEVADDVREYVEREDGEACEKHKPKRDEDDD